jgi:predicted nuclease of predicted toxin-antitoxin system
VACFLIDESLPRAIGRALVAAGHDVTDVRDVGLRGASDDEVMARAISEARAVVAGDTDFANTLRFPLGSHAGIVVLRLPNEWDPTTRATRAAAAITEALQTQIAGVLIIVDPARIRVLGPTRSR